MAMVTASTKGGRFFVLDRGNWEKLWQIPTLNQLNLVIAYLVLLAGTGKNHRLSKWSAKACEQHTGMGKPRAQAAIKELFDAGLAGHTETSTRLRPQYWLTEHKDSRDPIFLPIQLITGFDTETPILRRIRQTGDPGLLRMIVDLYGEVQTDATFGIPIKSLRMDAEDGISSSKIAEYGANTVWSLEPGNFQHVGGDWRNFHLTKGNKNQVWSVLWERINILRKIGAIYYEWWIFDGQDLDAEPLYPASDLESGRLDGPTGELESAIYSALEFLTSDRSYLLSKNNRAIILPSHHRAPSMRGVARMRIEADTPARRSAYMARMELVEKAKSSYIAFKSSIVDGHFGVPIKV